MDEAWLFFKNETIRNYIVEAEKTWRKHNAAMILATQSIKVMADAWATAMLRRPVGRKTKNRDRSTAQDRPRLFRS
jgi:hypothetical protein